MCMYIMISNMSQDPLDLMDLNVAFSCGRVNSNLQMKYLMPHNKDENLLDIISKIDTGPLDKYMGSLDKEYLKKHFQLFNNIKKKHQSTKYQKEFRRSISNKNLFARYKKGNIWHVIPKLCQNQVYPAQVREGIRRISLKLLPPQIIGNHRNTKKISKAFGNLMCTAKTEPFNLSYLVKSLKLESITWIQEIRDKNMKRIMMGKFIKWLFQLFIAVTEKIFFMSHVRGMKVFIFKKDWAIQKQDHLKLMCQRSALQLVGPATEFSSIRSKLCFVPKGDTLRPLTIHKFTEQEEQLLRQTNALLRNLYHKNFNTPNQSFDQQLIEIFANYSHDKNKIFAVSCDIEDAYGSILHGKLFDILHKMFETLPEHLKFTYRIVRKVKKYQLVTDDTNVLLRESQECITVEKETILKNLKKHIYQSQVIYKNNVYNINRGVTQGLIISGALCSIYYSSMNAKHFDVFKKQGYLFNYVDDYLFVTNQINVAKEFLLKVKNRISEYNCLFKKCKLQHNLEPQVSTNVDFLGWKFNFEPLKIEPIFRPTRYSLYFSSLTTGTLEFKLKRLASLKLNKLILTKRIIDHNQIFNNITLIYRRQAERCFALLSCLHNTQQGKVDIKSITRTNYYLLHKIVNFTNWDQCEKNRNKKVIEYIMWKGFFKVFKKKFDIFPDLTIKLKKLLNKSKKRVSKNIRP